MKSQTALSPREQQVVDLLLEGGENRDIAKALALQVPTVKGHLNRIFRRFGIRDGRKRVKLATLIYRQKQCQTDSEKIVS